MALPLSAPQHAPTGNSPAAERIFGRSPLTVARLAGKGRGALASRPLEAGASVLVEPPYACTVNDNIHQHVCHSCFLDPIGAPPCAFPCEHCRHVWYCSQHCRDLDSVQHQIECRALDTFLRCSGWEDPDVRTEVRLLLRILSRRFMERSGVPPPHRHRSAAEALTFDDFRLLRTYRRRQSPDLTARFREAAPPIRSLDAWLADADEKVIVGALLRSRANRFAVQNASGAAFGMAIHIGAALFNHSCRPNLTARKDPRSPAIEFLTTGPVAAGAELTVSYVADGPLAERRTALQEAYFFLCRCDRCREEEGVATPSAVCSTPSLPAKDH